MGYRLELRRLGKVIREYETDTKKDARRQAQEWIQTTFEAVVILYIDGKEIRLKDTAKRLGINGARFDNLKRYNTKEPVQHIIRKVAFSQDGRVRHKPTIKEEERW